MKKILCYVAIILLIVLIILPPALRILVKGDNDEEVTKDVVELLACTKNDESINMPYKNGNLTMIKYSFKEEINPDTFDFNSHNNDDENTDIQDEYGDVNGIETIKSILEKNSNTHKENINGEISYKLEINDTNRLQVPETFKGTIDVMRNYYTNEGYSCMIIK